VPFRQKGGKLLPSRSGAQRASRRSSRADAYPGVSALFDSSTAAPNPPGQSALSSELATRSRRAHVARTLIVALTFGLLGVAAVNGSHAIPAQAATQPAAGLKAVIIVGPASSSTWEYLRAADGIAKQAAAEGMDVDKIYTPHATWDRVKHEAQGANLLVYLGHGNGYPTQHEPKLSEDTEDGLGLNRVDGGSISSDVQYYGADFLRKAIQLAPNSVVFLNRLCYASGNGESGLDAPENYKVDADRAQALARVDNYAAGFLSIGAQAVFAWGWPQLINLPKELAESSKTMDQIFEEKVGDDNDPQSFIGKHDYYEPSKRTPSASIHLDPDSLPNGYLRALSGNLDFTAKAWRTGKTSTGPDKTPPRLTNVSVGSGTSVAAGSDVPAFSPNGDGLGDQLKIDRDMSEPGKIVTSVANKAGKVLLKRTNSANIGSGTTTWDGKSAKGSVVSDGTYTVSLTPIDRAGNVGKVQQITVLVLTALASPTTSLTAIEVADGDKLSTGTNLSVRVTQAAAVSWTIVNSAGDVVRHGPSKPHAKPGSLGWRWNGTNDKGAIVPDGQYRAVVTAKTAAGSLAYSRSVFVGAFRIAFNQTRLYRGQKVRIKVYNTELLHGALTLSIHQKDAKTFNVTMDPVAPYRQVAKVTLAKGGIKGSASFQVTGTDIKGGTETETFHQHVY
jgi:flagellar hook assembly protein FlgD